MFTERPDKAMTNAIQSGLGDRKQKVFINDELSMYTNYVRSKSTGSQNNISIALSYKTKPSDKCTETGANLDNLTDLETFEHQSHSCEITNSCRLAAELMEGNPLPADTQNGHLNHTLP